MASFMISSIALAIPTLLLVLCFHVANTAKVEHLIRTRSNNQVSIYASPIEGYLSRVQLSFPEWGEAEGQSGIKSDTVKMVNILAGNSQASATFTVGVPEHQGRLPTLLWEWFDNIPVVIGLSGTDISLMIDAFKAFIEESEKGGNKVYHRLTWLLDYTNQVHVKVALGVEHFAVIGVLRYPRDTPSEQQQLPDHDFMEEYVNGTSKLKKALIENNQPADQAWNEAFPRMPMTNTAADGGYKHYLILNWAKKTLIEGHLTPS